MSNRSDFTTCTCFLCVCNRPSANGGLCVTCAKVCEPRRLRAVSSPLGGERKLPRNITELGGVAGPCPEDASGREAAQPTARPDARPAASGLLETLGLVKPGYET